MEITELKIGRWLVSEGGDGLLEIDIKKVSPGGNIKVGEQWFTHAVFLKRYHLVEYLGVEEKYDTPTSPDYKYKYENGTLVMLTSGIVSI